MEQEYTYVLTVGDKVVKPIAVSWWSNEIDEKKLKGAMAATARVFKKTAGILVYTKEEDTGLWVFCDHCDTDQRLFIPDKLEISGRAIKKKLFRDYSKEGVQYVEGNY